VHITVSRGKDAPMDRETKGALVSALTARHLLEDESRTLFDSLNRTASSLAKIFAGEEKEILLPGV